MIHYIYTINIILYNNIKNNLIDFYFSLLSIYKYISNVYLKIIIIYMHFESIYFYIVTFNKIEKNNYLINDLSVT